MKAFFLVMALTAGCHAQSYVPDKFSVEFAVGPENGERGETILDEVIFGFEWELNPEHD